MLTRSPASRPQRSVHRLACCLLLALAAPWSAAAAPELTFETQQIELGSAAHHTVIPARLVEGEGVQLAVVEVGPDGDRRLRLFHSGDAVVEAELSDDVLFVDVAGTAERDRLLLIDAHGVRWLDPATGVALTAFEVEVSYAEPEGAFSYAGRDAATDRGAIPWLDVTRDLNQDALDDVVIPSADGFWIALQRADGSFSDPVRLGPPEPFLDEVAFDAQATYGELGLGPLTLPWYLDRLHQVDVDRDGRLDLAFWNDGRLDLYRQRDDGSFETAAVSTILPSGIDGDGEYSLAFGIDQKSGFALFFGVGARIERTALHSFQDADGDGIEDLITLSVSGRSLLRLRQEVRIHKGGIDDGRLTFSESSVAAASSRGKAPPGYAETWLLDLDGDGELDALFGGAKTGFGGMVRAMLNTSITLACEVHELQDGRSTSPRARRKIRADIDVHGGRDRGFWPSVHIGDVDGDGRPDLLVARSRDELAVYLGSSDGDGLAERPRRTAVELPGDERNRWLADLDGDGRQDLFVLHPDAETGDRLQLLLARDAG